MAGVRRGRKEERLAREAWEDRTREDRASPFRVIFTFLPFYGLPRGLKGTRQDGHTPSSWRATLRQYKDRTLGRGQRGLHNCRSFASDLDKPEMRSRNPIGRLFTDYALQARLRADALHVLKNKDQSKKRPQRLLIAPSLTKALEWIETKVNEDMP